MSYTIRNVRAEDSQSVISVFNYFIENSFAAYSEKKVGSGFFERLKQMTGGFPFYVVVTSGGELAGFGLLRPYHIMETFRRTAELTYFILPMHTGRGLGTKILSKLIEGAREKGKDNLLASISSLNEKSISFHKKNGFRECGRLVRIGKKFGKDFDEVWMQKFI
ncbi:MAG: GNAT family N-acetyltransferase [Syntrophomonadaceae bacterium]|nr:GNAT family N-acetyltransferase [Syntrophomonadaceae bacterium]